MLCIKNLSISSVVHNSADRYDEEGENQEEAEEVN